MNYTITYPVIAQPISDWDEFVFNHPNGNYFQSYQYISLMSKISGNTPVILFAKDENGVICGVLCGIITKETNRLKAFFSKRLIVIGGPLVTNNNPQITDLLLSDLNKKFGREVIYTEFRNLFLFLDKNCFKQNGFTFKPHLNFIVTLDDEKLVKKRMSESKVRQIKSSIKAGVSIEETKDLNDVHLLYSILKKLYAEKVKKPLPVIDLFLEFYTQNYGKIFVVKKGSEIIGGIVCPIFKNKTIYEWYVCGLDGQEKGVYPSVMATWAPMEYGLKNGIQFFDFMGAGSPDADYGVREFKEKFGGELVENGRFITINKPMLYKIGKIGLKIYSKLG
jgi:serine/alanine adding enzyme